MSVEELLAQLNDIQVPGEPGWWPLAQVWWYLFGILAFLWITLWFLKKRRQANQSVLIASNELEKIKNEYLENNNDSQLAISLSVWLKKVSLYAYPDQSIAGLTGQSWLEFLDNSSGNSQFSEGDGKVFADSIYHKDIKVNASALIALCEVWLSKIKPELVKQGQG